MYTITPAELKQWLEQPDRPQLLDVRQAWEYELCHIPDSVQISLEELEQIEQHLVLERPVVTICHHGHRSRQAAKYMENFLGMEKIHNLEGGIDAWAREIDPEMDTY
jgi:rhodanese-related sulfurtransferase